MKWLLKLKRKGKKNNELFKNYFANYQSLSDIYKKLCDTKGKKNKDQVYLINEVSDRLKEAIKNVSEDKKFIKENKMMINIVEHILYFNQWEQQGSG